MSHAGTEHKGVQETEKKYITLPAPCIRTLIRATELELQRLDAADPLNDHQVAQNTLESARKVVEGKDGEFAALPRETAAQLDDYAAVIHTNEVNDLISAKASLRAEFHRRGFTQFTPTVM